jgi:cell division protein FtsI (penicillin-binding protein 3)
MAMIKNEILARVYVVLICLILIGVGVVSMLLRISVVEGNYWRKKGEEQYVHMRKVEGGRGNILSADGSLLATSLPIFDLAFDPSSSGMSEEDFMNNIDSLAYCLATFVDQTYTPGGMRDYLLQKRADKSRYVSIKRGANLSETSQISQFPLFRKGQFRGGFIALPRFERDHPFGMLAHRTIGYVRDTIAKVGLEGAFDEHLSGESRSLPMRRAAEGVFIPIHDLASVEPKSGKDVRTTIDIDIQDVAEQALFQAIQSHDADYGVALVMEVETGAIRAIANIGVTRSGKYWETYNHAVGTRLEPGSTFKLATMMALLESGRVSLEDSIVIDKGRAEFYNEVMVDATPHSMDTTTARYAFEMSSNVGMARMVQMHFVDRNKSKEFINYLKAFNLNEPTGIEVTGEAMPLIKEVGATDWYGTTMPWMSIGYELLVTPLQMLTFYNAVANNGRMMKPYLVSSIEEFGVPVVQFKPSVLRRQIASKKTIRLARELLEGVVERGTAAKLRTPDYDFAGKTGTAQINYQRMKKATRVGGYQASFIGYFPARQPKYSCLVLISNPKRRGIYGSEVALPVFRDIADQIYASKIILQEPLNEAPHPPLARRQLPDLDAGYVRDFQYLLKYLRVEHRSDVADASFAVLRAQSDTLLIANRYVNKKQVPNVVGMGLRDALHILENQGLHVEVNGFGKVRKQSIKPGTPAKGQTIRLQLG